jgi:hypothetical protein
VAEVDSVEVADGDGAAAGGWRKLLEMSNDRHARRLSS